MCRGSGCSLGRAAGRKREDPLIAVHVVAPDRITGSSITSLLDRHPELVCGPDAEVVAVVDDVFLPSTIRTVQDTARLGVPIVLLARQVQAGLSGREVQILRLLADGLETKEIAAELAYSESTVKKDLHVLITRFNLRNRTQAVAFALRAGVL